MGVEGGAVVVEEYCRHVINLQGGHLSMLIFDAGRCVNYLCTRCSPVFANCKRRFSLIINRSFQQPSTLEHHSAPAMIFCANVNERRLDMIYGTIIVASYSSQICSSSPKLGRGLFGQSLEGVRKGLSLDLMI